MKLRGPYRSSHKTRSLRVAYECTVCGERVRATEDCYLWLPLAGLGEWIACVHCFVEHGARACRAAIEKAIAT